MPPTALCSAIPRMRRPMWRSSSTFASELSSTTAPAASAVTSLPWPKATPTVAAASAGASLIPSPMNSVGARAVSARTSASFCSGVWLDVHLGDADLRGQVAHLRLARSPETSSTRSKPCCGSRWRTNDAALGARLVAEADQRRRVRPSSSTMHSSPPPVSGSSAVAGSARRASVLRLVTSTSSPSTVPPQAFARASRGPRSPGRSPGSPRSRRARSRRRADGASSARGWRPRASTRSRARPPSGDHLGHPRLAVGQRAGLVEDRRAAGVDLLEHRGILDDDALAAPPARPRR